MLRTVAHRPRTRLLSDRTGFPLIPLSATTTTKRVATGLPHLATSERVRAAAQRPISSVASSSTLWALRSGSRATATTAATVHSTGSSLLSSSSTPFSTWSSSSAPCSHRSLSLSAITQAPSLVTSDNKHSRIGSAQYLSSVPSLASRRLGSLRNASTTASTPATNLSPAELAAVLNPLTTPKPSIMTIEPPLFPPQPPIPKAKGQVNLVLPPPEDRAHRYFTLPNGLECIVVSDPKADKAAASMNVGVGHLSDPDDLAGCAHFCEHLMFMGTEKYPSENEYSQYLAAHNGHSNAWTGMTDTNYFFDVAPDALDGAIDRFAGFFIEPLFADSSTEREVNAVNSEHKKNLQIDNWRFFQLEKSLAKEGHPYRKFGTGNRTTLWEEPRAAGRDPRQQLIDWWAKEYCARRMKLAIVGRDDLETLEAMVRKHFDRIPVRTEGNSPTGIDGVRITFEDLPFGPEQRGFVTFVKPVRDIRALEIGIPVPDLNYLPHLKPYHFVTHFLGHEGKGSILSYLKSKGWVNSLGAYPSHEASGFALLKVSVNLTPDGLEHWKDVAQAIFKYMALLRNSPPSEIAFEELRRMADISFRFAERGRTTDYVNSLSGWMQSPVEREEIVSSNYVLGDFDAEWLTNVSRLLDPRQAFVGVTCKELPKNVTGTFDQNEAIYGTEYLRQKLPEEFIAEAYSGAPIPELQLPGPNQFIPENLNVEKLDVTDPSVRPELLRDTELSRLWYKKDDRFWLPRTNVYVELRSPLLEVTPRNAVLARLLMDLFSDSTTEDVYDAELAELSFHLFYSGDALTLAVGGFTDKLALLMETMLKKLMVFEVDPTRFDKIVDSVKLQWKNFELASPFQVGAYWLTYVEAQTAWTHVERLNELEHITPADVQAFGREVMQRLYVETLVHGNTDVEGAKAIQDMVERVLGPRALTPAEKSVRKKLLLPNNSQHVWEVAAANPSEPNHAIVYYVHAGDPTDPVSRANLAFVDQIGSEPAFNVLRTKEQLGYVCQLRSTLSGVRVLVQSERDPVYVESRIESFLEGLVDTIENLADEEFERHRQSLIHKKEEQPKNLSEETRRFWMRITDQRYEFGKRERDIEQLRKTTKEDVVAFYKKAVHPASDERRKFSVHLRSQYKADKADAKGGAKFDPASAGPLVAAFAKAGVNVDQAAIGALLATSPTVETVCEFADAAVDKAVAEDSLATEAAAELKAQVAALKGTEANGEANGDANGDAAPPKLRDGNVFVTDIHKFKSGLTPNKAAVPLEPLVLSKL